MLLKNDLSKYLNNTFDYLPILSKSDIEILRLLNNKEITFNFISEIINKNHSLAARILAIANSPAYGFPKKISTVEMAISILGIEAVKDLVIGFSIINSTLQEKDRYFISRLSMNMHIFVVMFLNFLQMILIIQLKTKLLLQGFCTI